MHQLDVKGLSCPLPVLKLAKQMKSLQPGEKIELLATDPATFADVQNYCEVEGHELITQEKQQDFIRHLIKKRLD